MALSKKQAQTNAVRELRLTDGAMSQFSPERIFSLRLTVDTILGFTFGLLALVSDVHRLGGVSVWYDEAWSYGLAKQPLHVMKPYLWGLFQNMALYYFILHYWLLLLHRIGVYPTEFLLRLPSTLFTASSVVFVYMLGQRFFGRVAAVTAASAYLLSIWTLYAAQQARSYGLEMLLVCAGWYVLFRALTAIKHPAKGVWWLTYAVVMALAVNSHLFSLLVFIAQFCGVALLYMLPNPWQQNIRQSAIIILGSFFASSVLMLPILIDAKMNGGESTWIPIPSPSEILNTAFALAGGHSVSLLYLTLGLTSCAVVISIMARIPYLRNASIRLPISLRQEKSLAIFRQPGNGIALLLCWLCIPFALSVALSGPLIDLHLFYDRYLIVIVPALSLLVGIGISSIRMRPVQLLLLALVIWFSIQSLQGYYATAQLQDFRSPMSWLQSQYQAGDGLACSPVLSCSLPMDYYLDARPGPAHFDGDSPGIWNWQYYYAPPHDLSALQKYAAEHHRLFFLTLHWTPGVPFDQSSTQMLSWLNSKCQLVGKYETATVVIYLYDTGGSSSGN